ncbi:hypothetical protein Tco_0612020, partial [Tanacetum coccineum]
GMGLTATSVGKGKIVGIDETKEQKNETRRTNLALWDFRRLEVKL